MADLAIVEQQQEDSVQKHNDARKGGNGILQWGGFTERGPILPAYGSRERELALWKLYRHDYNEIFRPAVVGLANKIASTPWEIQAPDQYGDQWQQLLLNADFGRGWESFVHKLVVDFCRYDAGAYVELIAPGDPLLEPTGAVVGFGVLDSLRCYPTGDPQYPVAYYDARAQIHLMNAKRVVQFQDTPESNEFYFGYGDCALSRCVGSVYRQILTSRYVEQSLDDNPPPGLMVMSNLSEKQVDVQVEKYLMERSTDFGGVWGRIIRLYGTQTEIEPKITTYTFTQPPEKFDYEKYTQLDVKKIALALGVDIQDIWELTGGNIGSATQSEVLARKSKGKALGRLYQGIERIINQALPDDVEFSFKYQDAEEDQERAAIAQMWASIAVTLDGILTPEQRARLLANQVEAIKDVAMDANGQLRLPDKDPKSDEQLQPQQPTVATGTLPSGDVSLDDTDTTTKALIGTKFDFERQFTELVNMGLDGVISEAGLRLGLRQQLHESGQAALMDGLRDGGVEDPQMDDEASTALATWRAKQVPYVRSFSAEVFTKGLSGPQVLERASLWTNMSINPMYYTGLHLADKQARYMWVVNPLKEHCTTCLKLNGQIHRMKHFVSRNLLPQSRSLVCGGWKCGCSLTKTNKPASGRFRPVPYVRGRKSLEAHHHHVH